MRRGLVRAAAALGGLLAALLAAELVWRAVRPEPYFRPRIVGEDGRIVDLSEIIRFFRVAGSPARADEVEERWRDHGVPTNGILPSFHGALCYDRPRFDYFDEEGCVPVAFDRYGFRDEEFPLEKPPGEWRLLAMGDSFTFGQGVLARDAWPDVLERLLAARTEGDVQVINAGFTGGGSWPLEYRPWIESTALLFHPDVVVYGMCLNDMDRRVPMLSWEQLWGSPGEIRAPWLGGVSEILNTIQRGRLQRWIERHRPADLTPLVHQPPETWPDNRAAIAAMARHLEHHGVRFLLAVFPMMSDLDEDYPYAGLHAEVARFCADEEIEHLDLYPLFAGLHDRDLWVHPFDQHPNPTAHRLFAEGIASHLLAER